MPDSFTLHPGTAADINELVAIEQMLFDDSDGTLNARAFQYHLKSNNLLWVAKSSRDGSEQVAGYLLMLIYRKSARLYSIGVLPNFQKLGIASALMQRALEQVSQLNKNKIVLEVKVANTSAIALYKRLGFADKKVVKGYYYDGSDALRMEKLR
jgi:ribosomal-protein-alanine N-acetyltransferase